MIAFLRQLFLKDFWLKLFSLSLAVLTWITVSFAIQKEGTPAVPSTTTIVQRPFFNLPVLVVSSTADVRDFKVKPSEVEITVQGDPKLVEDLQSKDIRAIVDLTGGEAAGVLRRPIMVSTPPGVTYVHLQPLDVEVIFPAKEPARANADPDRSRNSL